MSVNGSHYAGPRAVALHEVAESPDSDLVLEHQEHVRALNLVLVKNVFDELYADQLLADGDLIRCLVDNYHCIHVKVRESDFVGEVGDIRDEARMSPLKVEEVDPAIDEDKIG